mmetsp:Transcript_8749/g.21618  ORF Transcript_8749/g.21618 Transcript_8749/m.21618 type:complete len:296 (-) Transcript_8749:931-1818(-)
MCEPVCASTTVSLIHSSVETLVGLPESPTFIAFFLFKQPDAKARLLMTHIAVRDEAAMTTPAISPIVSDSESEPLCRGASSPEDLTSNSSLVVLFPEDPSPAPSSWASELKGDEASVASVGGDTVAAESAAAGVASTLGLAGEVSTSVSRVISPTAAPKVKFPIEMLGANDGEDSNPDTRSAAALSTTRTDIATCTEDCDNLRRAPPPDETEISTRSFSTASVVAKKSTNPSSTVVVIWSIVTPEREITVRTTVPPETSNKATVRLEPATVPRQETALTREDAFRVRERGDATAC